MVSKLGAVVNQLTLITPHPENATDQPIRPIFQWNEIDGATAYELELADNPFYGGASVKKPLYNTVWAWDVDLEYGTTYYWRVRAISKSTASSWVQGVFTTMAEPKPEAPPVAPGPTAFPTPVVTVMPQAPAGPVPKYFDPVSGLYFNSEAELKAYQTAHPPGSDVPTTPAYIWAIIIIGGILVIAVIVLIVRTRRVT
jgi:hypothetical protein